MTDPNRQADANPDADGDDADLIPAATVLLLRDTADVGLEVLMLRRNSKIAFGGMWVFPGGRVDDDELIEGDPQASARLAAVREVHEETGLTITGDALESWTLWIPPPMPAMKAPGPRRRFSTWFFATVAPDAEVAIDHGEIHEDRWLNPAAALQQHRDGEIELVPPTWITLTQLSGHDTVASALDWAKANDPELFRTRAIGKDPITIAWAGDASYDGSPADTEGGRNRLILDPDGWQYLRSAD